MIQINDPKILSTEEEIRKAEIIHALKCVELNYLFASASNDGERFIVSLHVMNKYE